MDTTKLDDGGLAHAEQAAALAAELGMEPVAAAPATPAEKAAVLAATTAPKKKRAGYTTHKGQGTTKSKRRTAERSLRIHRQRK